MHPFVRIPSQLRCCTVRIVPSCFYILSYKAIQCNKPFICGESEVAKGGQALSKNDTIWYK